jgi:hypothetical protein
MATYGSQGNSSRSKTDEPTISCVRLVHSIGKLIAELVDDLPDLVVFFGKRKLPDDSF